MLQTYRWLTVMGLSGYLELKMGKATRDDINGTLDTFDNKIFYIVYFFMKRFHLEILLII